jgi:hypothetical protein
MEYVNRVIWSTEQVCSECGEGVFFRMGRADLPTCSVCGHEHPMDTWNLGEGEVFEWKQAHPGTRETLFATSIDINAYDEEE